MVPAAASAGGWKELWFRRAAAPGDTELGPELVPEKCDFRAESRRCEFPVLGPKING